MSNAQALTNAKRVFAAALEGRDEDTYGFAPWPDGIENGFDFTTTWTLSQAETDDVTLTAVDPDTGETVSLRYLSNQAEREMHPERVRDASLDKGRRRNRGASF